MNTQFVFLALSVGTTVIGIVLLLLVSALIGFLMAWVFQKLHYIPIVKKLEDEKEGLNRKIDSLNKEIGNLKSKVSDLEKVISEKEKEIEELKQYPKQ